MASEARLNFLIVAKDAATKAIRGIDRGLGKLKRTAGTVGRGFAIAGAAIATAATAIAGGIAYAVKQAADEEKGIARLTAAIAANVKGRTDLVAVEEQIAAQQEKLAFSDGELRDSLAALLPFTKSTSAAFKAQSVAADLARARGMSLEDASRQVGLALNGNQKVLKQLGISLPKTATKAQILAAIQGKVAGQAEAYANSTEGQFASLNNSVGDLVEDLGKEFLPIALDLVKWAKADLLPAIQAAIPFISSFAKGFISTASSVGQKLIPVIQAVVGWVAKNLIPKFQQVAQTLFGPGGVAESVMGVVGPIIQNLLPVFQRVFDAVSGLIGKVGELVGWLWGDGNGPLAIAVQAIGAALGIVGNIIATVADAISGLIDFVMSLGKAIADSPVGQLAGFLGDIGGALFGGGGSQPVPVAATSGSSGSRGITVPAPQVTTNVTLDGRQIAQSVDTRIGRTASATNNNRGG